MLCAGAMIAQQIGAKATRIGADCLRLISYGYVFYAYGMLMVQAFNGAGDTATPTYINLFCYCTISESLIAVVGMLTFRRGTWKSRLV